MNKRYNLLPVAALAAALTLTAACGTATEPVAAPSSSASATGSAVSEFHKARAREEERQLCLNAAAGLPGAVDRGLALAAAAQDGTPLTFSWGTGCAYIRTPDGVLWSLHSGGGPLIRDDRQRDWFKAHPGAAIAEECHQLGAPPTRPDPTITAPYRWKDGGVTKVSIAGTAYALPAQISPRGAVLVAEDSDGPTSRTN